MINADLDDDKGKWSQMTPLSFCYIEITNCFIFRVINNKNLNLSFNMTNTNLSESEKREIYNKVMENISKKVIKSLNEGEEHSLVPPKPWIVEVEMIDGTGNSRKKKFYLQMDETPIIPKTMKLTDEAIKRIAAKNVYLFDESRLKSNNGGHWRWTIVAEGDNAYLLNNLYKQRNEIDKKIKELLNK